MAKGTEKFGDGFGGPVGSCFVMASLPVVAFWLIFSITHKLPADSSLGTQALSLLGMEESTYKTWNGASSNNLLGLYLPGSVQEGIGFLAAASFPLPSTSVLQMYLSWVGFQVALHVLLPGREELGVKLEDGTRLPYNLNGFRAFVVSMAAFVGWCVYRYDAGIWSQEDVGTYFMEWFAAANLFSWCAAALLWLGCQMSWTAGLDTARCTGCWPYDYFMGCTKNPRVGWFDLKFFFESRPGLILWVLVNLALGVDLYHRSGEINWSMATVCFFQTFYIADYFWQEESILTTMDIKHDPFGWMLLWGDSAWVPFTYSLQALYIYHTGFDIGLECCLSIVVLHFAGYRIFRESNNQKHNFRTTSDEDFKIWGHTPAFIPTKRGTKLLASGWWGLSRHPNYLGDIMMALAYSLPCGFGAVAPYFYPIYFWILLVHRERRDVKHCIQKYGDDFERYMLRVPYRIIPYVY